MTCIPSVMEFGSAKLISPDGTDNIPADLWPELELLVLLNPEPSELKGWTRRLEAKLGVAPEHRRALAPRATSTGTPWTILSVAPLMERKVAETLKDAGVRTYVPLETYKPKSANVARAHRPWKARTKPLLSGYIFAEIKDDRDLDLVRRNEAVRLWCRDGRLVQIASVAIGVMVLQEACHAFDRTYKPQRPTRRDKRRGHRGKTIYDGAFQIGEMVRVLDGPFASFMGRIQRADRENRIEVLVSIFGRATPVVVEEEMIEAIA